MSDSRQYFRQLSGNYTKEGIYRRYSSKKCCLFKNPKKLPLCLILVVPFVLQIFVAVGLVGYLSFKNGQKAVNDLTDQLIDKASQQVSRTR
ncbi:hypothetical protein QUB80_29385 [Chlorogloeopsis sp. ULAP01]|uniref:hypothetical protein n=1 Tax=Chlorogloeopsis sp. ULAP01 TaxID=3056483 RepID=UPI0025AAB9A0|nr:hypothetical protein [Chlorogloeopsis sp. ULAP01]MDM9384773.1 hypothetical protein [Chlorogloeopsis sp. ULAP01]